MNPGRPAVAAVAAAVATALALSACGGGGGAPEPPALAGVVPGPPPGLVARPDRSVDFDLARYTASLSVAPERDREVLSGAGFRSGLRRVWADPAGGLVVDLYAFELADEAGAAAVLEAFVADGGALLSATPFEVPGLPGARGATYTGGTADAPTVVHAVYLTRGAVLANVLASHADRGAGPEVAIDVARRVAAQGR